MNEEKFLAELEEILNVEEPLTMEADEFAAMFSAQFAS